MPTIPDNCIKMYGGAETKVERLGLKVIWEELKNILTGFDLRVEERRNANGGAYVREVIDGRFKQAAGWVNKVTGDVDWTKCRQFKGARACIGVEIQMSARSDLLIVDVVHLRENIDKGLLDVGVLVAPADPLGIFLTDRGPRYSDAVRAVERAKAESLPIIVVGILHNGPGSALPKKRTRQGRLEDEL